MNNTPRFLQWGALGTVVLSGLSAIPLSPYVASGRYDRDRALVADCSQPWTPAPIAWASPEPTLFGAWGEEKERTYSPANPEDVRVTEASDGSFVTEAIDSSSGITSLTISTISADTVCQRLTVVGGNVLPTLPVASAGWSARGISAGVGIGNMQSRDLNVNNNSTLPSLIPGFGLGSSVPTTYEIGQSGYSTQGTRIQYLVNGEPGRDVDLVIQGVPLDANFPRDVAGLERYYEDWGIQPHQHAVPVSVIVTGAQVTRHPRIGASAGHVSGRDKPLVVRTGPDGTAPIKMWPGFRGNLEFLRVYVQSAQAQGKKDLLRQDTLYYPVLVRTASDLIHMATMAPRSQTYFGKTGYIDELSQRVVFGYQVVPSPSAPFLLVGHRDRHPNGHYLRRDVAGQVLQMTRSMWAMEFGPGGSQAGAGESNQYLRLNDMSLRYGGGYRFGKDADDDLMGFGHQGHDSGQEVDLSPLLGNASCRGGGAASVTCGLTTGGRLNEAFLGKIVISELRGVVFEEDGNGGHHYHLRFRSNSGNTWDQAFRVLFGDNR